MAKGDDGFRGISPLELIWKVLESMMNRRIVAVVACMASCSAVDEDEDGLH